jgi:FlaA1/EpsC-like NDP-sugar epimerase
MKKKILLFGAGGHANSCIDVIKKTNQFEIVGLIGKKIEIGIEINGLKVLGTENDASIFFEKGVRNALVTLGSYKHLNIRNKIFNLLKRKNLFSQK